MSLSGVSLPLLGSVGLSALTNGFMVNSNPGISDPSGFVPLTDPASFVPLALSAAANANALTSGSLTPLGWGVV